MIKLTVTLCIINQAMALFEGDKCTVPNANENGRCISIEYCDHAMSALKQRQNPQVCGFNEDVSRKKILLVCCPSPPGALSHAMCLKYFDELRQLSFTSVDLGEKPLSKEFPHMAAVGFGNDKTNIKWLCGGTLVSHYYVLSAAHCAESPEFGLATWIRLGDLDLKNETEDSNPIDLKIAEVIMHPEYRTSSYYHDIVLFKLSEKIIFGKYFKPACLHKQKDVSVKTLQATGWGKQGIFGDPSSHLMKVSLQIIDHDICGKRYENISTRKLPQGIRNEQQICAGDSEGRDTCPGDSGGPLHYTNRYDKPVFTVRHFVLVGITSFGKGCGGPNTAGVYTRVSSYVDWIENIIWPED